MSTMTQIISEHSKVTLTGNRVDYRCGAKGCKQIYGTVYPEQIVITAHVVNRLHTAGFGSKHDAWDEGFEYAGDHDTRQNPYPGTRP